MNLSVSLRARGSIVSQYLPASESGDAKEGSGCSEVKGQAGTQHVDSQRMTHLCNSFLSPSHIPQYIFQLLQNLNSSITDEIWLLHYPCPSESPASGTALTLVPDSAFSSWRCPGATANTALYNVTACPGLLFVQPLRHRCITGNWSSTMWLIPWWNCTAKHSYKAGIVAHVTDPYPGCHIHCDVAYFIPEELQQ